MHKYSVHNSGRAVFRFPSADSPLPLHWRPLAAPNAAQARQTPAARNFSVVADTPTITCFRSVACIASVTTHLRELAQGNAPGMQGECTRNARGTPWDCARFAPKTTSLHLECARSRKSCQCQRPRWNSHYPSSPNTPVVLGVTRSNFRSRNEPTERQLTHHSQSSTLHLVPRLCLGMPFVRGSASLFPIARLVLGGAIIQTGVQPCARRWGGWRNRTIFDQSLLIPALW